MLGELYSETREFEKAKEHFKLAKQTFEKWGICPTLRVIAKLGAARSRVLNCEKNLDLASLYEYPKDIRLTADEGWAFRSMGEILLNMGDPHFSEAEKWVQRAIEADQKNGIRFHLGNDYGLYAQFCKRKGDRLKAQENLGKATAILKECGADGWVEKYQKELALMQAMAG